MKKTLVALAVAAVAATSANAAVVYNQDGTKVEVGGSVRLLLSKAKDQRLDLINKDSRLEVRASHDLGEGLKALAYGRLNLGNEGFADAQYDEKAKKFNDSVTLAKLYAGFSLDGVGAFTFGRQDTNGDDVGLSDYSYNLGGINKIITSGNKVARFTSDEFHGLKLGLDYVFGTANKEELNNRGYVLSAFYDRSFGDVGFAFHAGYSHAKADADATPAKVEVQKTKAFTLGTELSYGAFAAAVDYSQDKVTVDSENVSKARAVELGLKYQVTEKSQVYTLFQWTKEKDLENDETTKGRNFIFGADYKVHPQVVTYLEGGLFRTKAADETHKDHVVNLGLRVFF